MGEAMRLISRNFWEKDLPGLGGLDIELTGCKVMNVGRIGV